MVVIIQTKNLKYVVGKKVVGNNLIVFFQIEKNKGHKRVEKLLSNECVSRNTENKKK